jgi:hypothetical protein
MFLGQEQVKFIQSSNRCQPRSINKISYNHKKSVAKILALIYYGYRNLLALTQKE